MFDILHYPPKSIEFHFCKPIPWLPFAEKLTRTCSEDLMPCIHLQAVSLYDIRIVLAQTLSERTFHIIDAVGRPILAHPLGALPAMSAELMQVDAKSRTCDAEDGCRRLCRGPAWKCLDEYDWYAVRLPKREHDAVDAGILFYHLRTGSTRLEWALLRTRPDSDSCESISSGRVDLACLTSSVPDCMALLTKSFSIEVLHPRRKGGDFVLQMHWVETTGSPEDCEVLAVHVSLGAFTRSGTSNQPPVACARIRTSRRELDTQYPNPPPSSLLRASANFCSSTKAALLPSPQDHIRLSNDGLRLFSLFANVEPAHTNILTIHKRAHRDAPWDARSIQRIRVGAYRVILSLDDRNLIIGSYAEFSAHVIDVVSPVLKADHAYDLLSEDMFAIAATTLEEHVPSVRLGFDSHDGLTMITTTGSFLCGECLVVSAGRELPRLVDLSQVACEAVDRKADGLECRDDSLASYTTCRFLSGTEEDDTLLWLCTTDPLDLDNVVDRDEMLVNDYGNIDRSRPLIFTTCFRSDVREQGVRETRANNLLVIHQYSQKVHSIDLSTEADCPVPFAGGLRHLLAADGQVLAEFMHFDGSVGDTVLIDTGTEATYVIPMNASVVLGRWSGDQFGQ